ncbi:glycoside hydrolase family 18 protein [Xanthobacter aminoxidans]|uniref:glycoside hydrolase family 18 protein n=1 Tax=Xanthobacter aminoxidans TaxID=186280 RepID=UPI002022DB3D|nr:glycoside hydrolase family 18 protein [Xanthobacter aminoxidans]MCL8383676.1 glycoside hydrolase family 18 protein [Xanthobacter aminoxidans]
MVLTAASAARAKESDRPFLAYLASWSEVTTQAPAETLLARLPGYFTHVALGFVKPDLAYSGNLDLSGTGLAFPYSGAVLKGAIAELKARHPSVRVLLAVGGWGYFGWDARDFRALAQLVRDLGADGVDLDYETADAGCVRKPEGGIACADDPRSIAVLADLRAALPRPFVISVAAWSVGAYGEGRFASAEPRFGPFVGMMRAMLKAPEAQGIDLVSIMSYDAGPTYSPEEAFRAYRSLWRGPLALGIAVMPSEAGGPRFTIDRTARLLIQVMADPKAGAMLYGLGLVPPGPTSPDNPDYRSLSLAICVTLERPGCDQPVP